MFKCSFLTQVKRMQLKWKRNVNFALKIVASGNVYNVHNRSLRLCFYVCFYDFYVDVALWFVFFSSLKQKKNSMRNIVEPLNSARTTQQKGGCRAGKKALQ